MSWPDPEDDHDERIGLHWKTRPLVDRAAGRPFIWIDDEISEIDRAWASAHHDGQALLHPVDASLGLMPSDFDTSIAWLRVAGFS